MDVSHPGADQHDDTQRRQISRRRFISVAAAGTLVGTAGASLLLSACQQSAAPAGKPATSGSGAPASSGAPAGGAPAKTAGADPFPKYAPVANAPKPDYQFDDPRYDLGFDNYPQNPFKSVPEAPGRGSNVNVLVANYFPPPTPF